MGQKDHGIGGTRSWQKRDWREGILASNEIYPKNEKNFSKTQNLELIRVKIDKFEYIFKSLLQKKEKRKKQENTISQVNQQAIWEKYL